MIIAGIDIGGTKCAVSLGRIGSGETVQILGKQQFPTPRGHEQALQQLGDALEALLNAHGCPELAAIGISCGGPLDSRRGGFYRLRICRDGTMLMP